MRRLLISSAAAMIGALGAWTVTPSAAVAGVVGLTSQGDVGLASPVDQVYYRRYCHRWGHRHWVRYYYPYRYSYAYPYSTYSYNNYPYYAPGAAAAVTAAASPFWFFGAPWIW